MHASSDPRRSRVALGLALGALGSVLIHVLVFSGLRWAGTMPAIDFELTLPAEVEFGVTHSEPVPEPLAAAPKPAPPPPSADTPAPAVAPAPPKPRKRPQPVDAGVPDAGDSAATEAAHVAEREVHGKGDRPLLSAFAPEGAQIALRLHMGRVRESELAADVRGLLEAVPDFKMILDGSGLDPLNDLERLYLASPDLRRTNLVMAGQYVGGVEVPERAVASLAQARGQEASWRTVGAIRVAPWHDLDVTERVVALIAPHQFAITRSEDLERVLEVARALAQRKPQRKPRADIDLGEALLALERDETLALSVEGVRLFARGNLRGVPERLEASVRELADGALDVRATGHFESSEVAGKAQAYWESTRARFADHPLVAFIGMRPPLASAEITAEDTRVEARTRVTAQQARVVLNFIRDALAPPPPLAEPARIGEPSPGERTAPEPFDRGVRVGPSSGDAEAPAPRPLSRPDP